MAELTADEYKTLGLRKWEIEKHLDAWDRNGIRPPGYAELAAERDRIVLALQGGEAGRAIGDTIRPKCMELARDIAAAINLTVS
jgi:hypothetical protein